MVRGRLVIECNAAMVDLDKCSNGNQGGNVFYGSFPFKLAAPYSKAVWMTPDLDQSITKRKRAGRREGESKFH